eukprot:6207571-Pleurochrysis_carterae.AAC.4
MHFCKSGSIDNDLSYGMASAISSDAGVAGTLACILLYATLLYNANKNHVLVSVVPVAKISKPPFDKVPSGLLNWLRLALVGVPDIDKPAGALLAVTGGYAHAWTFDDL